MNYSDMKNYDYIYDKNGKTIGIQAKYTKSGNFDADTNIAEQNGMKLVHIDGSFWFVDSKYENEYSLLNINDIQTVENLNFSQIVSAFQSGDLTVSELEKWCTANGVNDLTVESNELRNKVNVKFTHNGTLIELKCTFEASKSQVDDIRTSYSVNDKEGYKNSYEQQVYINEYRDYNGYKIPAFNHGDGAEKIIQEFLDYITSGMYSNGDIKFTNEQIEQYNTLINNQIRSGINGVYDRLDALAKVLTESQISKINNQNSLAYAFVKDNSGQYNVELKEGYKIVLQHAEVKDQTLKSPEEWYLANMQNFIENASKNQSNRNGWIDYPANAVFASKYMNYVTFDSKTIDQFEKFLSNVKANGATVEQSKFMSIFGLLPEDDKETIWNKVADFVKRSGGTVEDSTYGGHPKINLDIDKYYLALAKNIGAPSYLTVEDCRTILNDYKNSVETAYKAFQLNHIQTTSDAVQNPDEYTSALKDKEITTVVMNNGQVRQQAESVHVNKSTSHYYNYEGMFKNRQGWGYYAIDNEKYHLPMTDDVSKNQRDYLYTFAAQVYQEILTDEQRSSLKEGDFWAIVVSALTQEQIDLINSRNDLCMYYNDNNWYMKDQSGFMLMQMQLGNIPTSADDYYYTLIEGFADRIKNGINSNNDIITNKQYIYKVQHDGDNIKFTEDTVKNIAELLIKMNSEDAPMRRNEYGFGTDIPYNYMKMLGFIEGVNYTEEDIWAKINEFCKNIDPNSDGSTLSLEDYYNALTINKVIDYGRTYTQCQSEMEDMIDTLKKEHADYIAKDSGWIGWENTMLIPGSQSRSVTDYTSDAYKNFIYTPREATNSTNSINTTTNYQTNNTEYIEINDISSLDEEIKNEKTNLVKNFVEKIKNYRTPNYAHNPIFALNVNSDGTLSFGEKFKKQLSSYIKDAIANMRKDYASYLRGERGANAYSYILNEPFMIMLGLPGKVIENLPDNANNLYSELEDIINDPTKLDIVLENFCKSLGSTDGKSISAEAYYDKLAEYKIRNYSFGGGSNEPDFDAGTDNNIRVALTPAEIENKVKIETFRKELQQTNSEMYNLVYNLGIMTNTYGQIPVIATKNSAQRNVIDISNGIVAPAQYSIYAERSDLNFRHDIYTYVAGITENDDIETRNQKLKELFIKMGATKYGNSNSMFDIDEITVINYLLGNNSEKINYIQTFKQYLEAYAKQSNIEKGNAQKNTVTEYSTVPTTDYHPESVQKAYSTSTQNTNENVQSIIDFIEPKIQALYDKYFDRDLDKFHSQGTWDTQSNDNYANVSYYWKNEEEKNALFEAIQSIIFEAQEKFANILTSLVFDGRNIEFTTIYDNYNNDPNGRASNSITGQHSEWITRENGTKTQNMLNWSWLIWEPCVEKPKLYIAPTVYDSDIPAPPNDSIGRTMLKTPWNGIYSIDDGRNSKLYVWDAKSQTYLIINTENGIFTNPDELPTGLTAELDRILMSLVLGYNRTSADNIFEKNGKFYIIDANSSYYGYSSNNLSGISLLKARLREIDITKDQNAASSFITSDSELTSTPNDGTVNNSETKTEEETDEVKQATLFITYEEYQKEAKLAAIKKGLISDEKTGLYTKYDPISQKTYYWLWNPETKSFDVFLNDELDNINERSLRIKLRRQAILQRLNLTTNPNICTDNNGNYYDYNEESRKFELRK